jgi:hypothetical protein
MSTILDTRWPVEVNGEPPAHVTPGERAGGQGFGQDPTSLWTSLRALLRNQRRPFVGRKLSPENELSRSSYLYTVEPMKRGQVYR